MRELVSESTSELRMKVLENRGSIDQLQKDKDGIIRRVEMLEKVVLNKEPEAQFDIFDALTTRIIKLEGQPALLEEKVMGSCQTIIDEEFAQHQFMTAEADK